VGPDAGEVVDRISSELAIRADPAKAGPMARYMRDQFRFLGVMSAGQKDAWRAAMAGMPRPLPEPVVVSAALSLWDRPEREHQYLACTLVNRHADPGADASPAFLDTLETLITTKPWWDTVDALATRGVGAVVRRHPELRSAMDRWLAGDDLWLARSALLHMNRWKADADRAWLFDACLARAADTDFFLRKAIGWALREHSKVDERAVVAFVAAHESELSGLSRREALMWLERRRRRLGY
jgi:3-methyladenine DNA glycosylase AlkD